MAVVSKAVLKTYFETGDHPTQSQFEDLIDSLAAVSATGITSLTGAVIASGAGSNVSASIAPLAVTTGAIASAAVTTAKIEGRAVTLAKQAFGTQGQIFYYAASGVPSVLNIGASSQVLSVAAGLPTWVSAAASPSGIVNNGYRTNYYYGPAGVAYAATAGVAVTAGRMYAIPFIVGANETFTRIGLEVKTGSAGNVRFGIYNFANGIPTTLVLDAGTASTATSGVKEATISQALTVGVYALVAIFDATPTVYNNDLTTHNWSMGSFLCGGSGTTGVDMCFYETRAYGALPSTFTITATGTVNDWPFLFLRKV